jgi:membrane-associated phospholipid phosphatase
MDVQSPWRRIALLYGALFALTVLAYFFADRQLATYLRQYLAGNEFFPRLTHVIDPLGPLASIGVAIAGARAFARGSLTPFELAVLRICCAILITWALKEELKWAFGRTWPETWVKGNPNPSYFGNGVYGFFPFHGGQGYASFPSGHTAAATAFAGSLWFLWPRLRWLGILLTLCVAIGLLGADYHWLSDIIAGGTLGATTGAVAANIGSQVPEERLIADRHGRSPEDRRIADRKSTETL